MSKLRICIVQPSPNAVSETFLRAHADLLPATVQVLHNSHGAVPFLDGREILSQSLAARGYRKAKRLLTRRDWDWERIESYLSAFNNFRPDVVLAEYGTTGTRVYEACEIAGVPLVVHFHGYDASKASVLKENDETYREMFRKSTGIIAVSKAMSKRLQSLGADSSRLHVNPYGVDASKFAGASPKQAKTVFLGVGRFVEKKAPYLTILAFAEVIKKVPEARLKMIGDGPLLGVCRDIASFLGIADSVTFLGVQPHDIVANEMKSARAFVQHSIEASDGDCEGTPVAVLEAGASGLPVVSTRHAGIPDVVIDSETGFIVEEKDVAGMADRMIRLASDPALAARLGTAARERISREYTMEKSINHLYEILTAAANGASIDG